MAIAFTRFKDGKDAKMYEIFKGLTIARTGFDPKDIWGSCVADGAAQKVSLLASVEARVYYMHNGDKVGASTVGKLVQMKMKVVNNPFPEVNNLISKAHKLATHFLYGSEWYDQLWNISNALSGAHREWVNFFLDLNGTWISSHQSLFCSIGRNTIGLKSYTIPGNNWGVEDWKPEEWETLF